MMPGVRSVAWAAGLLVVVCCYTPSHAQTSEPCEDIDPVECGEMAKQGECETNPRYMLVHCRVSCKSCNTPIPDFPTIANPDFDCGRPYVTSGANPSRSTAGSRPGPQPPPASAVPQPEPSRVAEPARNERLLKVSDTFCGATPISDGFLLTSAYCVIHSKKPIYSVRLGELDFSRQDEANSRPVDYAVKQIIVHPYFNPNSSERYYDLALIQTVEKIAFNDVVFPYCLPAARPPPQTLVTGAGFGYVNATHQSPILQEAEMLVLTTSECEKQYQSNDIESKKLKKVYPDSLQESDLMCAGFPGRGPCKRTPSVVRMAWRVGVFCLLLLSVYCCRRSPALAAPGPADLARSSRVARGLTHLVYRPDTDTGHSMVVILGGKDSDDASTGTLSSKPRPGSGNWTPPIRFGPPLRPKWQFA